MYNSEQERHWYSFQIESNLRAIAHFEPIAARIVRMDVDERLAFRLEEGMGGSSPSIYERVVKKVYGRDQGNEILQALYDNPTIAVPIVLARLKQKDEEWKRALREWNKVWREVVRLFAILVFPYHFPSTFLLIFIRLVLNRMRRISIEHSTIKASTSKRSTRRR